MASGPRKGKMKSSPAAKTIASGSGVIYSNPSGDKALENVYKKVLKDPTFKSPKGGTFNVNTMKKV